MSLPRLFLTPVGRFSLALAGFSAALAIACGAAAPTAAPTSAPESTALPVAAATSAPAPTAPPATPAAAAATPRTLPTIRAVEEGEIMPILATTQLRVGPQRVSFLLASSQALIKAPEVVVRSTFFGGGRGGPAKRSAPCSTCGPTVSGAATPPG